MNYEQALKIHVTWEKEYKPELKEMVQDMRDTINEHSDMSDHCIRFRKKMKTLLFVMTYIHNKDYENAVKYYNRYKEVAYAEMEQAEEWNQQGKNIVSCDQELQVLGNREGAYLKVCEESKYWFDFIDNGIKFMSLINGDVKDVLKAGKKMNERKGKKNRGK